MKRVYKLNDSTVLEFHESYLENPGLDYFILVVGDTRIKINEINAFSLLADHLSKNCDKLRTEVDDLKINAID